jgi:hypothetical protein
MNAAVLDRPGYETKLVLIAMQKNQCNLSAGIAVDTERSAAPCHGAFECLDATHLKRVRVEDCARDFTTPAEERVDRAIPLEQFPRLADREMMRAYPRARIDKRGRVSDVLLKGQADLLQANMLAQSLPKLVNRA